MPKVLPINKFLQKTREEGILLLDARSPGEFSQGHIGAAVNLPLLNKEEREQIGITYKQHARKKAVVRGFELVGHKFGSFINQVNEIFSGNEILLYCWRGGMRSNIMAWLLQMAGYDIYLLEKGYKEYRNWVLNTLQQKYSFVVIGGKTGSGKTELLQELSSAGEAIIDLEKFASHKGSAFGSLGMPGQPTNEHFENLLAEDLYKIKNKKVIWIENESRNIGTVKIPDPIYDQIRNSIVIDIIIPFEKRLERILKEYGNFPVVLLKEKSKRIEKKLGPNNLKTALEFLDNNNIKSWAEILLNYYDQNYEYSNSLRHPETIINVEALDIEHHVLIDKLKSLVNELLSAEEAI